MAWFIFFCKGRDNSARNFNRVSLAFGGSVDNVTALLAPERGFKPCQYLKVC